jgi:membrane glycosyltransferase
MAFVASPLWLAFLVLSTVIVWRFEATGLTMVPGDGWLAPWHLPFAGQALGLFVCTLGLLFLPKVLALVDLAGRPAAAQGYGGWPRVLASVVVETLAFTLLAPVLMLFHTKFIVLTLSGRGVAWITQRRGSEGEPEWREAILTHGGQTLAGVGWAALAWWIQPALAAWMAPILLGLAAAIPMSLLTGQVALGRRLRSWGLFLVPEETMPPVVLRALAAQIEQCREHTAPLPELADDLGLMEVVLDPYVNALHIALLRERERKPTGRGEQLAILRERLLREGPRELTKAEKISLLQDDDTVAELHREVWSRPTEKLARWWQLAIRHYNVIAPAPPTVLSR